MAQFNNSPIDPNNVAFSAGAKVFVGAFGTAFGALPRVGLLASDQAISFDPRATIRTAKGGMPRTTVAAATGDQDPLVNVVVSEISQLAILAALGLEAADITSVTGADVVVATGARERIVLNADGVAALAHPVKAAVSVTINSAQDGGGTASVEDTDFRVIDRDLEGRTIIERISGGNIAANATIYAGYTYVSDTEISYPIGCKTTVVYRAVRIEDELTSGGRVRLDIPKAIITTNGAINLGAYEPEYRLPLSIQMVIAQVADIPNLVVKDA